MTVAARLFGFPSLTLAATAQAVLAIKLFPSYYSSGSHIRSVAVIFLANYTFGIIFWYFIYPRLFSPLRHIKGPRAVLSAFNSALLVKDGPSGDLFLKLAREYPGHDMIVLNLGGGQIFVTNPRLMGDILVHRCYDFAKPRRISAFLRYSLGDGLVIIEGDQHKFVRKNTTPAFHFRHIKNLYPLMWTKADKMTNLLEHDINMKPAAGSEKSQSAVVELSTWASKVTLDIIGIACLGRNLNTLEKSSDPLQEMYEALLEPSREKLLFAALGFTLGRPFVRFLPWKMNETFDHITGSLGDMCRRMIEEKRDALKRGDEHFDILSLLIKTNNFSDTELKDQILTFLAAGHETTASALTWACYLLAKHPDIQEKLRQEALNGIPEDLMQNPSADLAGVLEQLPYLNGIMNESFRLYPTVPITIREALRDTQVGDQFIPKGTEMIISMWFVNRSPVIWGPGAGEFRPERWITDGKPNQHGGAGSNYDFMTFLHGPRSCIGQNFARVEMRCLLSAMAMRFSWELAMDDAKVVPRGVITIKSENGMYLKLTPLK